MTSTDAAYELEDAPTRASAGLYPAEAAVRLLVEHGYWLAPLAPAGHIEVSDVNPTIGSHQFALSAHRSKVCVTFW